MRCVKHCKTSEERGGCTESLPGDLLSVNQLRHNLSQSSGKTLSSPTLWRSSTQFTKHNWTPPGAVYIYVNKRSITNILSKVSQKVFFPWSTKVSNPELQILTAKNYDESGHRRVGCNPTVSKDERGLQCQTPGQIPR